MDNQKLFMPLFGSAPSVITKDAIVTPYFPLEVFSEGCVCLGRFKGRLYSVAVLEKNGKRFSVIRCGVGDRLLGDAALLLGAAGVRNALFIGTCGGIRGVNIGDIIVPESAYNGEGFSRYYGGSFSVEDMLLKSDKLFPDRGYESDVFNALSGSIKKPGVVRKGEIFTVGSLMAEEMVLKGLEKNGFSAVEMELSAFFCAAREAGIKAAAALLVSDLPLERGLGSKLSEEENRIFEKNTKALAGSAVDFIVGY